MDEQKRAQFKKVLREIKNLPTLPGIVAKLGK
ncbi:MAG: HD family phosphohydrolase, partial [Deltaproteobacteria bacterium HGW-Deltaproteobacteria-16]